MTAATIGALINTAGISHHAAFERTTEAKLDDHYNVRFKGVFFLTQRLLPLSYDGGQIVMISSGLASLAARILAPPANGR